MTELEKLLLSVAAAIAVIHLIGPSAVWRIAKSLGECLVVILLLICVI